MRASHSRRGTAASAVLILAVSAIAAQRPIAPPDGPTFVENRGQWDARARYLARAGGLDTWLTDDGFVVGAVVRASGSAESAESADPADTVRGVALYLTFEGANPGTRPSAVDVDRRQGLRNYLLGEDSSRWVQGVRSFQRVRYPSMYEGIDLVVRQQDGVVEYDLECDPWSELDRVVVRCEGHHALRVDQDGTLVVSTAIGELRQKAPATWTYDAGGARCAVACRYRVLGPDRFGFAVDGWPRDRALTIDPGLVWSTYLGGNAPDEVDLIGLTSTGDVLAAGRTASPDFPTTAGAFQETPPNRSTVFVTRLRADGTALVFSTYLGGSGGERMSEGDLYVAADDSVYVAGLTGSPDFPTTPDAFPAPNPPWGSMAFVSKLDASGSRLLYSTLFGGPNQPVAQAHHSARGLWVDEQRGRIYLLGETSVQVPTTPDAFQRNRNGSRNLDVFLSILDRQAQPGTTVLHYSTHIGGTSSDRAQGELWVDANGVVTIAGATDSADFPTTAGAFQTAQSSNRDSFVVQLDPAVAGANGLVYGSYLGGQFSSEPCGVAIHQGRIVLVGDTQAPDWPVTADALQTMLGGRHDGYVTILDPALSGAAGLVYSTFLGGADSEDFHRLDLWNDLLTFIGDTGSRDLLTTPGAFQETGSGIYLAQLDLGGGGTPRLAYATHFGRVDTRFLEARDVISDATGHLTFSGTAGFENIPVTPGVFQPANAGHFDGFVARLDPRPLPPGSNTFGFACPCSAGVPDLAPPRSVHVGRSFDVEITGLTASGTGVLNLGVSRTRWGSMTLPFSLTAAGAPGCTIYTSGEVELPLSVSAGRASFSFPVPNTLDLVGSGFFMQFALVDPTANSLGVATSNAGESEVRF